MPRVYGRRDGRGGPGMGQTGEHLTMPVWVTEPTGAEAPLWWHQPWWRQIPMAPTVRGRRGPTTGSRAPDDWPIHVRRRLQPPTIHRGPYLARSAGGWARVPLFLCL